MKFFARRPRSYWGCQRPWVLVDYSGRRMPDVAPQATYADLLTAAGAVGYRDVELRYPRGVRGAALRRQVEDAVWAGDVELLSEIAPCRCCCHEHTFADCPARLWHGCRGSGAMTRDEEESWVRHYAAHHGMTRDQFFGG